MHGSGQPLGFRSAVATVRCRARYATDFPRCDKRYPNRAPFLAAIDVFLSGRATPDAAARGALGSTKPGALCLSDERARRHLSAKLREWP